MDPNRRYSQDEMTRILERATDVEERGASLQPSGEGLTLAEIQEIGSEVGIAPDAIARAATTLQSRAGEAAVVRGLLGLPLAVARTVELPARLSDAEWASVVVDLRETFDARGRIRDEGAFRQWTNGNLQALLEPSPSGERLRLSTLKGQALALVRGASVLVALAAVTFVLALLEGPLTGASLQDPLVLLTIAAALAGAGLVGLPAWAAKRTLQMDQVAGRLLARMTEGRAEHASPALESPEIRPPPE
jgi:hypothetical protein